MPRPLHRPSDWKPRSTISIWSRLRSWWAWKEIEDAGVWVYFENAVTGERKAVDKGGCWQPIDYMWLAERNGRAINRYGDVTYF